MFESTINIDFLHFKKQPLVSTDFSDTRGGLLEIGDASITEWVSPLFSEFLIPAIYKEVLHLTLALSRQ